MFIIFPSAGSQGGVYGASEALVKARVITFPISANIIGSVCTVYVSDAGDNKFPLVCFSEIPGYTYDLAVVTRSYNGNAALANPGVGKINWLALCKA